MAKSVSALGTDNILSRWYIMLYVFAMYFKNTHLKHCTTYDKYEDKNNDITIGLKYPVDVFRFSFNHYNTCLTAHVYMIM